jgi:hypothetical protein
MMQNTLWRVTCICLLTFSASPCLSAEDKLIQANLNGLEIGIDPGTGGLRHLAHATTGEMLEMEGDRASLLDVAFPVKEFLPLRLATRFSKARIERSADALVIVWEQLGPSRTRHATLPAGNVAARIEFRAAPDGRSVILTCQIDNKSSGTIPQVLFPDFQGLLPFAGADLTTLQFANGLVKPFSGPARTFDPNPVSWIADVPFWVGQGWHVYQPIGLYAPNAMRWFDLGGHQGGMSMFQKRWGGIAIPKIFTHRSEADPDRMRLAWENRVTIGPGESWTSDEFWLTPHAGGWAKGIDVFREYVAKVNPPRQLPTHVRDGVGFMTIMMSLEPESDPEHAVFRFNDLPRVARDAREHGIDEIVPWLWCRFFDMPMVVDERLGTTDEFVSAVQQCKQLGVNISPFVDVKIVSRDLAKRYGATEDSRGFQGSSLVYHPELIPHIDAYYMEPAFVRSAPEGYPDALYDLTLIYPDNEDAKCNVTNELWQQDAVAAFKEWIDRGVTSFSWDLFHSVVTPGGQKSVVVDVAQQVRAMARARDPQSVFSGECTSSVEYDSPVLDYTWNWARSLDSGPVMNVLRTPRQNYNVEDSVLELKQAFCAGLYINIMPRRPDGINGSALISEQPALSAELKKLVELRKQFLPLFTEGLALGDSMLSETPPCFVRGYQLGNKLLFIALNRAADPGQFTLRCDLSLWHPGEVRSWSEKYYDDQGKLVSQKSLKGAAWTGTTQTLKTLDMAFF